MMTGDVRDEIYSCTFNCTGVRHCFKFQLVKIQINFVYLNNKKTSLVCDNDPNKHHARLFDCF